VYIILILHILISFPAPGKKEKDLLYRNEIYKNAIFGLEMDNDFESSHRRMRLEALGAFSYGA
jgi:hypothetical protein